jgi:hypothetical protein
MSEAKILFVGPGAVGASVAAWVAESYSAVFIMGHGATQAALRKDGITTYWAAAPEQTRRTMRVAIVDRLGDIADVDIVVLAVKNYSLEAVARQIKEELTDRPIIVSMANGIDNQRILPKFFSRVIYGVVAYNAWRDGPAVIGYQQKGPLLIGTPDNSLSAELQLVQSILSRGCPTQIVDRLQDAVHKDRDQSHQCAGRAGRPRLAAFIEPRRLSAASLPDSMGGRAHHSRRRLSRIPHSRDADFSFTPSDDADSGLRHSPGVQAQDKRHGDVEHDSGCGVARCPGHRA